MKLYENCSASLNATFQTRFSAIFYFLKIKMAMDSFSGCLAFDYHAVVLVKFFFFFFPHILIWRDKQGKTRVFCFWFWFFLQRLYLDISRAMEGGRAVEGTDRSRYCGIRCLGKLMNAFSADLAPRPLRTASFFTFTSQPMCGNHGTHHGGWEELSPRKAPSRKMLILRECAHDFAHHIFENLFRTTLS